MYGFALCFGEGRNRETIGDFRKVAAFVTKESVNAIDGASGETISIGVAFEFCSGEFVVRRHVAALENAHVFVGGGEREC